jgi:hypothetical protein
LKRYLVTHHQLLQQLAELLKHLNGSSTSKSAITGWHDARLARTSSGDHLLHTAHLVMHCQRIQPQGPALERLSTAAHQLDL